MSIPEPQAKQACTQSSQHWMCLTVLTSHGNPHISPRDTGHSVHPTPDIPGGKYLSRMGYWTVQGKGTHTLASSCCPHSG